MMNLYLASDLHLETRPASEVPLPTELSNIDVAVLAGDIGNKTTGILAMTRHLRSHGFTGEVVAVSGNHEFEGGSVSAVIRQIREACSKEGIHFLEKDSVVIGGVRFLGTTLWPSLDLDGDGRYLDWQDQISDFSTIFSDKKKGGFITPAEMAGMHKKSLRWLKKALAEPVLPGMKTVVVTHFPPLREVEFMNPLYRGPANYLPYFYNDLSAFVDANFIADHWIFGHVHHRINVRRKATLFLSNPLGYRKEVEGGAGDFDPEFLLRIEP